jgi:hypothetical protein
MQQIRVLFDVKLERKIENKKNTIKVQFYEAELSGFSATSFSRIFEVV